MEPYRKLRLIVALAIATAMTVAVLVFNTDVSLRNSLPGGIRSTINDAVVIVGFPGVVASLMLRGNVHQPENEVYYLVNFAVWAAIVYLISMPFTRRGK